MSFIRAINTGQMSPTLSPTSQTSATGSTTRAASVGEGAWGAPPPLPTTVTRIPTTQGEHVVPSRSHHSYHAASRALVGHFWSDSLVVRIEKD